MHDPRTVAFEIPNFFVRRKASGYRPRLITIWHVDPETDGSDDSAGWFIRLRHVDKELTRKVKKEFLFRFKHNHWFDKDGERKFSTSGVVLGMYREAAWQVFMHKHNGPTDKARKETEDFLRKHVVDILLFSENYEDSLYSSVNAGFKRKDMEMISDNFVSIILPDIMRKIRPWYRHPKWNVKRWEIQFHPLQNLKRRYWDKCCICGKRGFKNGDAHSDWSGKRLWHGSCAGHGVKQTPLSKD